MSEPMANERIEQIRARRAAATQGPMHVSYLGRYADWISLGRGDTPPHGHFPLYLARNNVLLMVEGLPFHSRPNHGDAHFYAHAWEDIGDLLAEVDRLRQREASFLAELYALDRG